MARKLLPVVAVDDAGDRPSFPCRSGRANEPAIGYSALFDLVDGQRRSSPRRVTMAAVSAARPSLPAGSCAEPPLNSSLTLMSGDGTSAARAAVHRAMPPAGRPVGFLASRRRRLRGRRRTAAPRPGAARDDSAGAFSMPAGSASFDSVVTIRPRSVKILARRRRQVGHGASESSVR